MDLLDVEDDPLLMTLHSPLLLGGVLLLLLEQLVRDVRVMLQFLLGLVAAFGAIVAPVSFALAQLSHKKFEL